MAKKHLTAKQAKFAKEYLETGNATEAAMQVYKPKKRATARAIGSENLTKPNIQRTINDALEAQGLTNEHLAGKVAELVNAQKRITIMRNGELKAIEERMDTPAVKAGLEFAFKLKEPILKRDSDSFGWMHRKTDQELEEYLAGLTGKVVILPQKNGQGN